MIRPARYWVLPVRGPPNTTSTSSEEIHTRSSPTRHSCNPTSAVGSASSCHHRARRVLAVREGRTVAALRRIATPDPTRATSQVEATPDLRRVRAPQRVTVADVRENRCQPTPTASSTDDGEQPQRDALGELAGEPQLEQGQARDDQPRPAPVGQHGTDGRDDVGGEQVAGGHDRAPDKGDSAAPAAAVEVELSVIGRGDRAR